MVHLTIGKGDMGYKLTITVTESDGTVKDLTGYLATFQAWKPSVPDTYIVNSAAVSTASTTGQSPQQHPLQTPHLCSVQSLHQCPLWSPHQCGGIQRETNERK